LRALLGTVYFQLYRAYIAMLWVGVEPVKSNQIYSP